MTTQGIATHEFSARGIGYDAGVLYDGDFLSRPSWSAEETRRDLGTIRTQLGCNTVLVMATDVGRLLNTARIACEEGLHVWIQPRLFDASKQEITNHLREVAQGAEELRLEFGGVALNIGCELSLSAHGFTPGRTFSTRGALLPLFSMFLPIVNFRLRRYLKHITAVARAHFNGHLSYGAGSWERPDWRIFDVVGLDAYRESHNAWTFGLSIRHAVRKSHRMGKPLYVFEFGTCSYAGAAERAAQASDVLEDSDTGMRVSPKLVRDETVQATYLDEFFDVFADAGVDGTFVWGFSEPALTHSPVPGEDLDIASYGIVAPLSDGTWRPKSAFHTVAARYR